MTKLLFVKGFSTRAFNKSATPDDKQLALINKYALDPLKAEDVYVRKILLAHNCIDRDIERFSDSLLKDFSTTLPGKSFLENHNRNVLPLGLYFDASTEEMTPEEFKTLTGEAAKLPEDVEQVKVLWAWFYMMKMQANEKIIININGGVYRHASIGFAASKLTEVRNEPDGIIIYWQYDGPGEAREGSLVWLGAQQGAGTYKSAKDERTSVINSPLVKGDTGGCDDSDTNSQQKGGKGTMEKLNEFIKQLSTALGKVLSVDKAIEEIQAFINAQVLEKTKALEDRIIELSPLAADGKTYRGNLTDEYVRLKAVLKEVSSEEELQKTLKETASKFPLDFLKSEVDRLQDRVDEKFPDKAQLEGDDERDKSKDVPENEKDMKKPEHNPGIPKKDK